MATAFLTSSELKPPSLQLGLLTLTANITLAVLLSTQTSGHTPHHHTYFIKVEATPQD